MPPVICQVTTEPGVIVTLAGENVVPTVVTTLFPGEAGVDGLDGLDGVAPGGFVVGSDVGASIAAPPPPHAVRLTKNMTKDRLITLGGRECARKFAS